MSSTIITPSRHALVTSGAWDAQRYWEVKNIQSQVENGQCIKAWSHRSENSGSKFETDPTHTYLHVYSLVSGIITASCSGYEYR